GGARTLAADDDRALGRSDLGEAEHVLHEYRPIDHAGSGFVQPVLMDALRDADHLAPRIVLARCEPYTLADRGGGLLRELPSEIRGDHHHAAARLDIAPSDVASCDHPRA